MIVSIHQPHFLPWIGYFNKLLSSDVFVWLHTVQYRKNYYQNRTKIKNINGEPLWLTLPVHARLGMQIAEVKLADARWQIKVQKTIEQCYKKTPFFQTCWPALLKVFGEPYDSLDDINFRLLLAILNLLNQVQVKVLRSDDIPTTSQDSNERLIEICKFVGASHYIAGKGGHNYMNVELFTQNGVTVIWQDFDPTTAIYSQIGQSFVPGLSIIDCLFNVGPEKTLQVIKASWNPLLSDTMG